MRNYSKLFVIIIFASIISVGCGQQNIDNPITDTAVKGGAAGVIQTIPANPIDVTDKPEVSTSTPTSTPAQENPNIPKMVIDKNKSYSAVIKTDLGDIEISLNVKQTPITANNFVWLAKKNFYNGVVFHRVIKGFMIQGGDPKGTGTGGPGYMFNDEVFTGDYVRGTVAMANSGPNTNGSQFFIMQATQALPKDYVIFGKVTKGIEIVDKIASAQVTQGSDGAMSKPVNPVKMKSVTIIEK